MKNKFSIRIWYLFCTWNMLVSSTLYAQNILSNPSFELVSNGKIGGWDSINGSPDIYCSKAKIGLDTRFQKKMNLNPMAFDGDNCLGIAAYTNLTEVIQGTLQTELIAGHSYIVSAYVVKPRYRCNTTAYEISMAFAANKHSYTEKNVDFENIVILNREDSKELEDTINWMVVNGEYTAFGGEKYLMIGNFKRANSKVLETATINQFGNPVDGGNGCYYYYYDSVTVVEKKTKPKFTLENINFDDNSYELIIDDDCHFMFDNIAKFLQNENILKIEIVGYTDFVGSKSSNLELSKMRAISVQNHLVVNYNIDKDLIQSIGMGESNPLSADTTASGRRKNRRVEIFVYEKNE